METKSKTKKPVSEQILNAAVVITMKAYVVLAVWQIPTAASSLEEIKVSVKQKP